MIDEIITTKKQLKDYLNYELSKYKGLSHWRIKALFNIESAVLYRHIYLLRKTEYHFNAKHKLRYFISLLKLERSRSKHSIGIPLNVCKKGLHLVHFGSIVINSKTEIGYDCSLSPNVCVFAKGGAFTPKIGNNVIICAGAVVMGDIEIADGSTIGVNAVVNKSFTIKNPVIAGVPAKLIKVKE